MPINKLSYPKNLPVIVRKSEELTKIIQFFRAKGEIIGFVPTMGALHKGHLSLVEEARQTCSIVIMSIFVNPSQFNDPEDFKRYPRTEEQDLSLIGSEGCDVVFIPSTDEMYSNQETTQLYDLKGLDARMEGEFRPGHFNGVATIVGKFFKLVKPHHAFFGIKDLQQLSIIRHFASIHFPEITIHACPIIRESNGLAMSSRNELFTPDERSEAGLIYEVLIGLKQNWQADSIDRLLLLAENRLTQSSMQIEYLEIVDFKTLLPFINKPYQVPVACIAVRLGKVRLIDNMFLTEVLA